MKLWKWVEVCFGGEDFDILVLEWRFFLLLWLLGVNDEILVVGGRVLVIELKGLLNSGGVIGVVNERLVLGFCGFVVECRLDCERGGCIRENDWCD